VKWKFGRKRWIVIVIAIIALILLSLFVTLRLDFGQREDEVLRYFSQEEGMPGVFAELEQLTPNDSIILCWWDYGRAVEQWSHREVIEAYPSRDIWNTMASSRDPLVALETQIFGTWGSSEKIHDLARIFTLPEAQSLQLMQAYRVSYAVVFTPDDLEKFNWIASVAGYDGTLYLTANGTDYKPTALGSQVTILRLLFDDMFHPTYFTKLFDNSRGKIYRINYP
jgi:subtilisin family serine protease